MPTWLTTRAAITVTTWVCRRHYACDEFGGGSATYASCSSSRSVTVSRACCKSMPTHTKRKNVLNALEDEMYRAVLYCSVGAHCHRRVWWIMAARSEHPSRFSSASTILSNSWLTGYSPSRAHLNLSTSWWRLNIRPSGSNQRSDSGFSMLMWIFLMDGLKCLRTL